MRTLKGVLLASVILGSMIPARAGVTGGEMEGFTASFSGGTTAVEFSVAGRMSATADYPPDAETYDGVYGCASVYEQRTFRYGNFTYTSLGIGDYGCGILTLTLSDDLTSARAKGSIQSLFRGGKMKIDITFANREDLIPYVSYSADSDGALQGDLSEPGGAVGGGGVWAGLKRAGRANGSIKLSYRTVKLLGARAEAFRAALVGASL